jgi:hypothetical protein
MKKIISICLLFFILSCSKKYIITKKRVGNYILDKKNLETNNSFFTIKVDNNNIIKSIIVTNPKYKTINGFGVGSNIDSIRKKRKKETLKISKGNTVIGNLGEFTIHNGICFVDNDGDNIIDFVWIQGSH